MDCYRVDMNRIVRISPDILYYRNDRGDIDEINLQQCRNRYFKYVNAHLDEYPGFIRPQAQNEDCFKLVANRSFSAEYPFFEFFEWGHIRFEIRPKHRLITKLLNRTGWNWKQKHWELFRSIQQQLLNAGWQTYDLD